MTVLLWIFGIVFVLFVAVSLVSISEKLREISMHTFATNLLLKGLLDGRRGDQI
jgi:cytochrome c-type biogenesis protein CcmH/NrfF